MNGYPQKKLALRLSRVLDEPIDNEPNTNPSNNIQNKRIIRIQVGRNEERNHKENDSPNNLNLARDGFLHLDLLLFLEWSQGS
jgi:hypothetical protein